MAGIEIEAAHGLCAICCLDLSWKIGGVKLLLHVNENTVSDLMKLP